MVICIGQIIIVSWTVVYTYLKGAIICQCVSCIILDNYYVCVGDNVSFETVHLKFYEVCAARI